MIEELFPSGKPKTYENTIFGLGHKVFGGDGWEIIVNNDNGYVLSQTNVEDGVKITIFKSISKALSGEKLDEKVVPHLKAGAVLATFL